MSVMSVSHREPNGPYQQMQTRVSNQVRAALDVPDNYHVLFMHGGAHGQFSAVPLNLVGKKGDGPLDPHSRSCAGIDTGFWARRAALEHAKYTQVAWSASAGEDLTAGPDRTESSAAFKERDYRKSVQDTHLRLPATRDWNLSHDDSFVHICANETIGGLEFKYDPDLSEASWIDRPSSDYTKPPPLVGDFTSTLLSRPVDVSKYGVIYCSGGKNLGPAGVTLVLVRDDLLGEAREHMLCPSMLSYGTCARSMPVPNIYLTPPTFGVYMMGLCLEHLAARGGLAAAEERSVMRAEWVYEQIDRSGGFYVNNIDEGSRSRMSIPFRVTSGNRRSPDQAEELEQRFLAQAHAMGFRHMAGHPMAGGVRASMYLGVEDVSIHALADFMDRFRRENA